MQMNLKPTRFSDCFLLFSSSDDKEKCMNRNGMFFLNITTYVCIELSKTQLSLHSCEIILSGDSVKHNFTTQIFVYIQKSKRETKQNKTDDILRIRHSNTTAIYLPSHEFNSARKRKRKPNSRYCSHQRKTSFHSQLRQRFVYILVFKHFVIKICSIVWLEWYEIRH